MPDATPRTPDAYDYYSDYTAQVVHQALEDEARVRFYPGVPTSLVPLETTVDPYKPSPVAPNLDANAELHTSFRHSGWHVKRQRVYHALTDADASDSVRLRFKYCGAHAWILSNNATPAKYRIACDHCNNRWCDACARERRTRVCNNLRTRLPPGRLRFLTLTLKADTTSLTERLDRLNAAWRKFRHSPKIKRSITGGIAFIETKWKPEHKSWHAHLHVLFQGAYLDQKLAALVWHNITGDSFIVDVREVKKAEVAIGYVAKYASKAVDESTYSDHQALTEAIRAMRGRRLFNTFGTWSKLGLQDPPDDDTQWYPLMPLHEMIRRANSGDADARSVLAKLNRQPEPLPLFAGDLDHG